MSDSYEIELVHNNKTLNVIVDSTTYDLLISDPAFRLEYAEAAYNQSKPLVSESETVEKETEKINWTDSLIKCLLQCRLSKEGDFSKPVCKKLKMWKKISEEIKEITGISIDCNSCDNKYRNLLNTYRNNKKKQNSTGEGAITWPYFSIMDEVLGLKASSVIPAGSIGETLDEVASTTSSVSLILGSPVSNDGNTDNEHEVARGSAPPLKKRRLSESLSMQNYLYKKYQREETKDEMRRKKEEEKLEWEKEKWKARMQQKDREIDAILELAKAISNK